MMRIKKSSLFLLAFAILIALQHSCTRREFNMEIPPVYVQTHIPAKDSIHFVFSKSNFDISSAQNKVNYTVYKNKYNGSEQATKVIQEIEYVKVAGKRLIVKFKKGLATGVSYYVEINNVLDDNGVPIVLIGNDSKLNNFSFNDLDNIRFIDAAFTKKDVITIEFDYPIHEDYLSKASFLLKASNGKIIKPDSIAINEKDKFGSGDNKLILTFKSIENDTYNLEMQNVTGKNLAILKEASAKLVYTGEIISDDSPTQWYFVKDLKIKNRKFGHYLYLDADNGKWRKKWTKGVDFLFQFSALKGKIIGIVGTQLGLVVVDKNIEDVKDALSIPYKFWYSSVENEKRASKHQINTGNIAYKPWATYKLPASFNGDVFDYNKKIKKEGLPIWDSSTNSAVGEYPPIVALPKRTIIFKTRGNNYGKMQIISLHKDNVVPELVDKDYEYSITLKVVVQKDGSTNLDIPVNY